MAELSAADRQRILRGLMRYWSNALESVDLLKSDLLSAINATDTWINDNQSTFNQALPQAAQDNLAASQKALLFCAVALMRFDPGVARLLKLALQTEVE